MPKLSRLLVQMMAYAAFVGLIAYFSKSPEYEPLDPNMGLISLSFSHAGARKGECHRLTPEEIAALPPNMRKPLDCPRQRLPLLVELHVDGKLVYRRALPPSGIAGDGASTAYERFAIAPGRHLIKAKLRDTAREQGFDYESEQQILIEPRQNFVIDFRADAGGFKFL
jgi:hypothetical protein